MFWPTKYPSSPLYDIVYNHFRGILKILIQFKRLKWFCEITLTQHSLYFTFKKKGPVKFRDEDDENEN